MVIASRGVQRDAGAGRDLVTDHDLGQKLLAVHVAQGVCKRKNGRQDGNAGMPFCQHMPIVRVQAVHGHSSGQRCPCHAGAAPVEQYAGFLLAACQMPHCVLPDDAGKLGLRAACGNTQQIQDTTPCLGHDLLRQILVAQLMDEIRRVHGAEFSGLGT